MRKAVMMLGAVSLVAGLTTALFFSTRPAASASPQVHAVLPQVKDLFDKVTAPASIVVFREIEIRARVAGLAMAVLTQPGDEVQAGQVLARIDSEALEADIQRAKNELAQARAVAAQRHYEADLGPEQAVARLKAAELSIRQAEARLLSATESARGQLPGTQSRLAQARASVEATSLRFENETASDEELTAALQQLAAAQAELAALNADRSPEIREVTLQVEFARQSLEQTQLEIKAAMVLPEQLAAADVAVTTAENSLASLRRNLAELEVRAPVAGTILEVPVRDGRAVQAGTLIAVMGQSDRHLARGRVNEQDIAKVEAGQPVVIRSTAFPADSFKGKVMRLAPQSTATSAGTMAVYEVDIEFDDPAGKLRLGMNVDTEITVPPHIGSLTVPAEALHEERGERYVWIVEEGKAIRRPVVVGLIIGGDMEVVDGLGQEALVISGPDNLVASLREGQPVTVISPER